MTRRKDYAQLPRHNVRGIGIGIGIGSGSGNRGPRPSAAG
ncbi:hypothetical protein GLA29479_4976 [Lysobacter antibioticus]|nr:hypothetical protein GLA29479_4976 [Lysobacter antibioticus]